MPVNLTLIRNGTVLFTAQTNETVVVGRRQVGEPREPLLFRNPGGHLRLIIADLEMRTVPRTLVRLEPVAENKCNITNLHKSPIITILGIGLLSANEVRLVSLPSTVQLPDGFSVLIQSPNQRPEIEIARGLSESRWGLF